MVTRFYGLKILKGELTIDDVPKFWRNKTEQWLNKNANNY